MQERGPLVAGDGVVRGGHHEQVGRSVAVDIADVHHGGALGRGLPRAADGAPVGGRGEAGGISEEHGRGALVRAPEIALRAADREVAEAVSVEVAHGRDRAAVERLRRGPFVVPPGDRRGSSDGPQVDLDATDVAVGGAVPAGGPDGDLVHPVAVEVAHDPRLRQQRAGLPGRCGPHGGRAQPVGAAEVQPGDSVVGGEKVARDREREEVPVSVAVDVPRAVRRGRQLRVQLEPVGLPRWDEGDDGEAIRGRGEARSAPADEESGGREEERAAHSGEANAAPRLTREGLPPCGSSTPRRRSRRASRPPARARSRPRRRRRTRTKPPNP